MDKLLNVTGTGIISQDVSSAKSILNNMGFKIVRIIKTENLTKMESGTKVDLYVTEDNRVIGVQPSEVTVGDMSSTMSIEEENKELLRHIIKGWNELAGDVSKIRSLYVKYYAPGYIFHHLHRGDMNLEQAIQDMVVFVSSYPDFNYTIDDLLAEDDKVILRYTSKATHKGTFMGIPATVKKIVVKGVEIYKITEKKVLESWDFHDLTCPP